MEKKTYTKFDLERLQKEYNNANSKRSEEVILQMMEEVKIEISKGGKIMKKESKIYTDLKKCERNWLSRKCDPDLSCIGCPNKKLCDTIIGKVTDMDFRYRKI